MAQYGAPNPVYEANSTPLVNRGQQGGGNSSWGNLLMGTQGGFNRLDKYDPDQMGVLQQILQQAMGGMNQFDFAPIEQQARTGFEQNTLPSIAERFTSMGGQGSGAFQRMLGSAGAGLEQNLAAMKQQYNLQREPLLQNLLNMGLRERFDMNYQPGSQGLLQSGANALMGGFGSALGTGLTGGLGSIKDLFSQFGKKGQQQQPFDFGELPKGMFGQNRSLQQKGWGFNYE